VGAATPAAAPAPARPPLAPQLAAPVLSLVQAADGDHRITVTVSPEDLGPVTVRAHISGDGLRIELAAPSEAGRDAIRHILADLRRDLAAVAPHATLTLAAGDAGPDSQPGGQPNGQSPASSTADPGQPGPRDGARPGERGPASPRHPAEPPRDLPAVVPQTGVPTSASFDVFA
jgi:flagellar hook-length control protein FliK